MPYKSKEDKARWFQRNRERLAIQMRGARLRRRYNLTLKQFDEMRRTQHDVCWICYIKKPLVVDHNHTTGKVRGLLCETCNRGLGQFHEDKIKLQSAIQYLEKYES